MKKSLKSYTKKQKSVSLNAAKNTKKKNPNAVSAVLCLT